MSDHICSKCRNCGVCGLPLRAGTGLWVYDFRIGFCRTHRRCGKV